MCGQFLLAVDAAQLAAYYDIVSRIHESIERKVIYPKMESPVIIRQNSENRMGMMQWGFQLSGSSKGIINARSETLTEKKMFAPHLMKHRCVIPFSAYYEWNTEKKPYTFYTDEPFAGFAGLYRKEANGLWRFVIVTKESTEAVKTIHNRMPVVLDKEAVFQYLNEDNTYESLEGIFNHSIETFRIEEGKRDAV